MSQRDKFEVKIKPIRTNVFLNLGDSMFIFTVFFGKIAKISSGGLPYSLFILIGLIFWGFFSNTLTQASNSLVENEGIIIPLGVVIVSLGAGRSRLDNSFIKQKIGWQPKIRLETGVIKTYYWHTL